MGEKDPVQVRQASRAGVGSGKSCGRDVNILKDVKLKKKICLAES